MLAITIDVDWSPDPIVESVLRELVVRRIPATLYATNPDEDPSGASRVLSVADYATEIEIGWHPQFRDVRTANDVVGALARHYPGVAGWKGHNGVTGWQMQNACKQHGLTYEVLPWSMPICVPPYRPYADCNYWLLHNHFMDAEAIKIPDFVWQAEAIPLLSTSSAENLIILTFHPTILYYDMRDTVEYAAAKAHYHAPAPDKSFLARPESRGAMRLLRDIVEKMPSEHFTTPVRFLAAHC